MYDLSSVDNDARGASGKMRKDFKRQGGGSRKASVHRRATAVVSGAATFLAFGMTPFAASPAGHADPEDWLIDILDPATLVDPTAADAAGLGWADWTSGLDLLDPSAPASPAAADP